jgi:hypothetical protein
MRSILRSRLVVYEEVEEDEPGASDLQRKETKNRFLSASKQEWFHLTKDPAVRMTSPGNGAPSLCMPTSASLRPSARAPRSSLILAWVSVMVLSPDMSKDHVTLTCVVSLYS